MFRTMKTAAFAVLLMLVPAAKQAAAQCNPYQQSCVPLCNPGSELAAGLMEAAAMYSGFVASWYWTLEYGTFAEMEAFATTYYPILAALGLI